MKYRYRFVVLLVWIIACLFFFHVFYQQAKENAIADLNARQTIHAKQAVKGIEEYFDHWITLLAATAQKGSIIDLDDTGKSQMDFILENHAQGIKGISRVDQKGRLVHTIPYDSRLIGADLSGQKHVQEIIRTHKPVLSGVFTAVQGFRALALQVPVFKAGEYRGTLGLNLDFEIISKTFLQDIVIGKTGYAWMVDREGIELYCPVPGHTGNSVFDNCRDFPTILSMAKEMLKGKQGTTAYLFDRIRDQKPTRVRKYAVYVPVKIANTFWSIVVATAEDEVLASLEGFRNELIGVIAVLLLGSVLFSYYAMKSWGIVREEKKRREAESELRESEENFRDLYDEAPVGYHELDGEGRIVRINKMELGMLGYIAEEVLGQPIWRFVVEEGAETMVRGKLAGVVPPSKGLERTYRRKDGTTVPVLVDDTTVLDKDGRITGLRSTIHDITERKRTEEALRESEEHFRLLIENAPDGIYVQTQYRFAYLNPVAMKLFGAESAEQLLGQPVMDRFNPRFHHLVKERIRLLNEEKKAVPMLEQIYLKADGSPFHVEAAAVPILWRADNGALVFFRDITERKRAEEEKEKLQGQLIQTQKMESVGRLAGGVAHDFNNMLGIIIGNAEMAAIQVDPDESLYQSLQEILKAGHRAADTVRQLLAFARKQTISPRVLDLNDTVPGMLKMLRKLIGEDIELHWIPGKDVGTVRIDPSQVNQTLANLVINSRDAIPGVGKITVESANARFDEDYCREHEGCVPGEYVLLAVSDTGTGMSPEIMGHLFDPFFTTKEVGRGTGLGLATVYGIVKQNNGFINVYSEPGQGTTFKMYLPRFEGEAVTAPEKKDKKKLPKGTETVLLAEDEGSLLNISRDILQRQGYTVLAARTPTEALTLAEKHQGEIHLLLTDVVMPEMNGRELMGKLHALRPKMKGLFMSGYTANVVAHHGVLDEGVHFIEKPFSPIALAEKVREVLDKG